MAALKERAATAYMHVKYRASDCCSSLAKAIRESKTKKTIATNWRRMHNRVFENFRNRLAPIMEREDGHQSLTKPEITRTTKPRGYRLHHQIVEEKTRPLDYLRKCRMQSLLHPGDLLLPIWSTEGGRVGGGGETPAQFERNVDSLSESFTVQDLEQYLVYITHSSALRTQLESIPREDPQRSSTVALEAYNKKKNRYKNNLPYDDTRVVLEGGEFEGADYINANYIEGISGPQNFIATQGPMASNTLDDFWRMAWQTKTNIIVMLGNLEEGGKAKISRYWPEPCGTEKNYGLVNVRNISVKEDVNWLRRHFLVNTATHSREVIQYHYTAWPDHDVPESPYGASRMVKDMTRWRWTGPPVIHCSAGLGRTGTILLVLGLLEDLHQTGHFQPLHILRSLRTCRANLLDNYFQYRYAHQILLETLYGCKTRFPLDKFSNYIISSKHQFSDQYRELKGVRSRHTYNWAKTHDPNLNRDNNVLPADGRQILLALNGHANEYLNAVRVHGSNLRDTFVVTEHPKGHTIIRCWRMVYMCKASVWIILHDHPPNSKNFPSVLPDADYAQLEDITVQIMGKSDKEFFTETHVTVSQGKLQSHNILLITFKNWCHTCALPNPPESLLFLVNHVEEIRRSVTNKVTIVSCSDGYSGSGMFVALVRMVTEMQLTQSVDVYRTVQSILLDRPQFIISQNQYLYLHDAILLRYRHQKTKQRETESKNERPKPSTSGNTKDFNLKSDEKMRFRK